MSLTALRMRSEPRKGHGSPRLTFFGLSCIQVHEFFVSSSFKTTDAVNLIREVILERGQ